MPVRIGDPALGRRPQVRHVEVRVEDLAERPRDRRRGHQQDVRRACAAGLRLELAALLDAEPVLLVDDDDAERGERDPLLDQRVRPDDDRRHARTRRARASGGLAAAVSEPVSSSTGIAASSRSDVERPVVLPGEEVRRREERALEPGPRRRRERVGRDRRLARADVALEQPEHRRRAGEVGADVARSPSSWSAVSATSRSSFRAERARRGRRAASASSGVVDGDRPGRVAPALPPPADHAELEREQLVEREPPQRGVAALERRRVVGLLERRRRSGRGPRPRGSVAAGTPGRPCPARSSASRIAIRKRVAVRPAVSR